ncbi:MAG: single-stranded-DNA-specific exonuclease RecJ [Epulopiscium sp. Nele67-Bin005]|nr:MAG: single-stranded-DNA-specific exonuclease RecJ [Epulopiscium sp. Nele67-Bin005]
MLPSKYQWSLKAQQKGNTIVNQILNNRGIDKPNDIDKFLNPSKKHLYDPYLLIDIEKSVNRILTARNNQEHITIYGDYDVDGVTSTSILYMFLSENDFDVDYYIPNRHTEGYGLNNEAILKISDQSKLIITVDTGIAAVDEITYANTLNVDVIVTDHHECQDKLPPAFSIVNPKRPECTYPCEVLAGVGVVFKLIHALAIKEGIEEQIWKYLDIVALGTVADIVPLTDENRVLTYLGFVQMEQTEHVGLNALLNLVSNKEITAGLIGYQIGPRINAAGRLSDAKIGVRLLISKDTDEVHDLAKQLDEENTKRKQTQRQIGEEVEKYIAKNINLDETKLIIAVGDGWHHGVVGIVASRIISKYYKPTIILRLEDGMYVGSARSIEGFNIFEAIHAQKQYLTRHGGHEMAAGLSLEESQLQNFIEAIQKYSKDKLTQEILTPSLDIDARVNIANININLYNELQVLEPLGANNPTPLIQVSGMVQSAKAIGADKATLKLVIQKNYSILSCIGFGMGHLANYLSEGEPISLVGEISKNEWNGNENLQFQICDIRSPFDIEVSSYYYKFLFDNIPNPIVCEPPQGEFRQILLEREFFELAKSQKKDLKFMQTFHKMCYNNHDKCQKIFVKDEAKESGYLIFETEEDFFQLQKMIATYNECKKIYKFLLNCNENTQNIHYILQHICVENLTEYKFLQCLKIFKELSLIDYEITNETLIYKLQTSTKTSLENSNQYQHLQQFQANINLRIKEKN